ncbi:hypothetical protein EIG56_04790 [Escherichia coli]|nr:hypothetical protein [Escherichia coli]MBB2313552.1 phage tail protein [Escherichia coli]HBE3324699.1 phage tail protein [Escherichia coli]
MATKYYAVLTNVGAAKLANATALGAQVEITQMAVGDGNGVLPTPNPAQTALVHELRRKPLNSLSIDPNNANQIIAEQVIPEDEGGWWIREIGLFDKDGDMIAVANCAETYKPQLQEGSGRVQVVRMILIVSSTAAVTLKIDPSVVLATRQYVDDQIIQVKSYVDQKMAAHVAAADPHKQYAPKESPALTGRPTAPTAEGKDSSTQIANTAFVQAAIAALVGSSPEALDTLNELAAALGNDPNFATTVTNSLAGKMDKSANGSDIENVSVFLQNLGLEGIQVTAESFGVVSGLVSITVAKSNADKIMQKAAELSAAGGGRIVFTKSLYQVHMDESDFSSSTATIRVAALRIPYDNVILCGQGWNSTTIQAYATNSAYGVIQWSKAPLQNGITKVHGVGLHNICIDGNYHGDFTSASYVRQTEGVVGAGIEGLSINNLKVKNCSHYGLGLQNGGYKGCVIDGYWSENTGADGIDIKDNGSVSRAFHLNNIFVFNFGQLDEPNNPWAGVDVMSIAPKVSNVYVSDFGDVGCPGAGVRIKQGPIGSLEGRGSSAWANVSDITVVQNRFGADYTTLIGLHIKAPFVNFNNIVAIGDEGGRLKNGVWIEERHCRGSNIQIANAEDGLSVTASTSGTSTGREYGNGDDTVINGLVCRDVSRAAIINRKYAKLSGVTFKDCPVGFVSGGGSTGKITIRGVHLDNVTDPFGRMGGTLHSITDVTGPSSADWQAGIGVIKGANDLSATTIFSKNGVRLYSGSTEDSPGTELARFAATVSDVFSPLRVTGNVQPVATNTYSVGTSSSIWAGGFTQTAFTVTSDELQKSRPVMLARGSLEPEAVSDPRLMEDSYADIILDAWAEVDFVQFQFIDRIEAKGDDGARWHFGIIAQRAKEAFERHGLDPHSFAFFCYDPEETIPAVYESVPAVYEVVPAVYDDDGKQVSPELWNMTEPAHEKLIAESYVVGEKYGIRYEEALVMEAALQRRNIAMVMKRMDEME